MLSIKMCIMQRLLLLLFLCLSYFSCKKDSSEANLSGEWIWTLQSAGNPAYNSTPQSTGINEILSFDNNGNYSVSQNGVITNSGTYKTSTAKNTSGETVLSIKYTNARVTDSVDYYMLTNTNDSLIFSYDLIGAVGSGSRHYGRK
jgi:hypothetical protein